VVDRRKKRAASDKSSTIQPRSSESELVWKRGRSGTKTTLREWERKMNKPLFQARKAGSASFKESSRLSKWKVMKNHATSVGSVFICEATFNAWLAGKRSSLLPKHAERVIEDFFQKHVPDAAIESVPGKSDETVTAQVSISPTLSQEVSSKLQEPAATVTPTIDQSAGALGGKIFVLSGTFAELGGGSGLNLGKDRAAAMIRSSGGQVRSAVSGKTDFVLVGNEPGRTKVNQARKRSVPMIDLEALQQVMVGQTSLESARRVAVASPPRIKRFSPGFQGQWK
jgi:hypothetical protein